MRKTKVKMEALTKSVSLEHNYQLFKDWLVNHKSDTICVENKIMNTKKIKDGQWLLDNYLGLDMWVVVYEDNVNNDLYDYFIVVK